MGAWRMGFAALYRGGNRDMGARRMGFAALYPSYVLVGVSGGVKGGRGRR